MQSIPVLSKVNFSVFIKVDSFVGCKSDLRFDSWFELISGQGWTACCIDLCQQDSSAYCVLSRIISTPFKESSKEQEEF